MTTHRDDGSIIENVVLCAEDGRYGGSMGWGETMILGCHNKDGVIEEDTGLKR